MLSDTSGDVTSQAFGNSVLTLCPA